MILIVVALVLLVFGFLSAGFGNTFATMVQTIGMLLFLYALPRYINAIVVRKFPTFGSLIRGEAPYHEKSSLPKRIVLVGLYAAFLVVLGLAGVVALYFGIDLLK